jgi:hypothetical protein
MKKKPIRLLICGDRKWNNHLAIAKRLRKIKHEVDIVITGACEGADNMADSIADVLGIDRVQYPANWSGRGKAAGPIRNTRMLTDGKPNLVWAFHHDLTKSKGTLDMVTQARNAGIEVKVFDA